MKTQAAALVIAVVVGNMVVSLTLFAAFGLWAQYLYGPVAFVTGLLAGTKAYSWWRA
jgi:hypothetical protein